MATDLRDFIINVAKKVDSGELPSFPDPGNAPDLGSGLTQAQIDKLKNILFQIDNLFLPP